MPWKLAVAAVGIVLLGTIGAQASEATTLAARAGFLLGHAQRCGVNDRRLEAAAAYSRKLIAAFAVDDDDRQAAQAQFAERVLASALAAALGDPLPPCAVVKVRLAELERHRRLLAAGRGNRGERQMAEEDRSGNPPARSTRSAAARPAKSAKRATTKPEELTPDRRAALELRRAAQRMRGRPPSI
jgi:hypothetical protein